MNNEDLKINQEHLKLLIRMHSTTSVGEVMKRFEVGVSQEEIKKQVKELIYEQWRNFSTLLIAYGLGKESIKISFVEKNKGE